MDLKVMNKSNFVETATIEEYIAYLYLAIAGSDLIITEKELYKIGRRISGILVQHFPDSKFEFKSLLRSVKKEVQSRSPMDYSRQIELLNKKYPLAMDIQMDVVSDLNEIINVDDKIEYSEYVLMNFIKVCFIEKK